MRHPRRAVALVLAAAGILLTAGSVPVIAAPTSTVQSGTIHCC